MKNRTPWQRMALSLIGIATVGLSWYVAIAHLYSLRPEAFAAFVTLTVNAQYVIGAIVIFMVTGRLIYEWKMDTSSRIVEAGEQLFASGNARPRDHQEDMSDEPPIP